MPSASADFLSGLSDHHPLVAQLLYNRGLTENIAIKNFLDPDPDNHIHSFREFKFIDPVVDLIIQHIKNGSHITVYGDYDADGVTASALLVEVLATLHARADVYLPERVSEGYGLNNDALKCIADKGTKLIVTVDTGIRNKPEVEYAKELGLDIVITDHHTPPENPAELPNCPVLSPLLPDETYPFKLLAGVGVAYKLMEALVDRANIPGDLKSKLTERGLDLLAIGTVADCVALLDENRAIVKKSLPAIDSSKRIGLLELIEAAKINTRGMPINSWNIGFQIAPRLNAAGRMDHANTAYELLTTTDKARAKDLAKELNFRNIERQKNTEMIREQVEEQIPKFRDEKIIIAVCPLDKEKEDEIWNEGIIGLVAGRICEKYYKPTLVITKGNEGYKGSGRSIEEFNLIEAVNEASEYLEKHGGHPAACGFSLSEDNIDKFREKMKKIAAEKLKAADLKPKLKIEAELDFADINEELISELEAFEPFGQENDKPRLLSKKVTIMDIQNLGGDGQHLKLRLKSDNSRFIGAIGFGQSERWQELRIGDIIDIVYFLEMNHFNGRSEPQLKIIDIRKSE